MKRKNFKMTLFRMVVLGYAIFGVTSGQVVSPAKVDERNVVAIAGTSTNITCESFGNPISLCIWEKFSPNRTRSSTLVSYTEGSSNTSASLPGFYLFGDLKSGVCGVHKPNISRVDSSTWQCTLFSDSQVYRDEVHLDVVNKPDPPKFIPAKLDDLVDGETLGSGSGASLTCYSAYGLPPPTFKWYLGDDLYKGDLYPMNVTEDADGSMYTFQQIRNHAFTWRENGKKLRCVIIHDMITEDDTKEVSLPINVIYKPRSEQESVTLFVPELGIRSTNLTYSFYANPKPRIYWEIDGVGISLGFSTDDRRIEAIALEQIGLGHWRAVLKVTDIERKDLRRRYVLKTENSVGKQDFELCLTQIPSRQGLKCSNQALFLQIRPPKPPRQPAQPPTNTEEEERPEDLRSSAEILRVNALREKLRLIHRQMQSLREQETRIMGQIKRMKTPKSLEEVEAADLPAINVGSSASVPQDGPTIEIGTDGPEHSEVKVESAGIYIRRKPGTSTPPPS